MGQVSSRLARRHRQGERTGTGKLATIKSAPALPTCVSVSPSGVSGLFVGRSTDGWCLPVFLCPSRSRSLARARAPSLSLLFPSFFLSFSARSSVACSVPNLPQIGRAHV